MKCRGKEKKEHKLTNRERLVIQAIGAKVLKETRWLNLLSSELMNVGTGIERDILKDLISKAREKIKKLEKASLIILGAGITDEVRGMVSAEFLNPPKRGRKRIP